MSYPCLSQSLYTFCCQVGDGMLIFGGETADGSLVNTLWRFDFGKNICLITLRAYRALLGCFGAIVCAANPRDLQHRVRAVCNR